MGCNVYEAPDVSLMSSPGVDAEALDVRLLPRLPPHQDLHRYTASRSIGTAILYPTQNPKTLTTTKYQTKDRNTNTRRIERRPGDDDDKLVWPTWAVGALFRGRDALTQISYMFSHTPSLRSRDISLRGQKEDVPKGLGG
jgi:hypothetical protein